MPTAELLNSHKFHPPLPSPATTSSPRSSKSDSSAASTVVAFSPALKQLVSVGDSVGRLLQNRHQGFLNNVRQQRAAGLAAAELAQAVTEVAASRAAGRQTWVESEGASGQGGCR